jgi:hypothetical protein
MRSGCSPAGRMPRAANEPHLPGQNTRPIPGFRTERMIGNGKSNPDIMGKEQPVTEFR